jgi:hypothetical protein
VRSFSASAVSNAAIPAKLVWPIQARLVCKVERHSSANLLFYSGHLAHISRTFCRRE